MRILHVAETLKGGIATYLNELIGLQLVNTNISLLKLCYPEEHDSELLIPRSSRLPLSKPNRSVLSLLKFGFAVIRAIKIHEPDIIHLHSTFSGFLIRLLLLFYDIKVKIVYCPHGWSFLAETPFYKKYLFLLVELILQINTSKIVNISSYEHTRALSFGFLKKKSILIVNGIAPPPPSNDVPNNYRNHKYNFVFVGRLDRQKGYDLFMEIAENISQRNLDIGFHLVGESVINSDKHIDRKLLSIPRLYRYGWMERASLFNFLHHSTALIMPSRWEGFGLVAIESLACKCPVIASDRGALPEILHDFPSWVYGIDDFVENTCNLIIYDVDKIHNTVIDDAEILRLYSMQRLAGEVFNLYGSILIHE